MTTQVEISALSNGLKTNGKIRSKNQLRRLKAKQKKAEKTATPVRKAPTFVPCLSQTNAYRRLLMELSRPTSRWKKMSRNKQLSTYLSS